MYFLPKKNKYEMNKSRKVISDFNCTAISVLLKEEYFYSTDTSLTAESSICLTAKSKCNFIQKVRNISIEGQSVAHCCKSFCSEIRNALNSEEEASLN